MTEMRDVLKRLETALVMHLRTELEVAQHDLKEMRRLLAVLALRSGGEISVSPHEYLVLHPHDELLSEYTTNNRFVLRLLKHGVVDDEPV